MEFPAGLTETRTELVSVTQASGSVFIKQNFSEPYSYFFISTFLIAVVKKKKVFLSWRPLKHLPLLHFLDFIQDFYYGF